MEKALQKQICILIFLSIITHFNSIAQFVPNQPLPQLPGTPLWTIGAQVRQRGEFRQGTGNPLGKADLPGAFISQRSNLNLGFRWDKMNFMMDVRDVRVWGQDAGSINNNDGSKFFLHQAWGEFTLATTADTNCKLKIDNLSLKVGRQEISYDDVRLIGNLDWLQQGRRHDAVLLKFLHKGYQADLGFAYNQNTDAFGKSGSTYIASNNQQWGVATNGLLVNLPANFVPTGPGNTQVGNASTNAQSQQYKMFQYLYLSRKFNQTKVSILGFIDEFQKYRNYTATVGGTNLVSGRLYDQPDKLNARFTVGGQFTHQIGNASEGGKILINGGAYYQGGKYSDGQKLSAYHAFAYATYSIGKWTIGPGYDILSGNSMQSTGTVIDGSNSQNNRFDPLYGTPHRWWGFMDYFYVGTGSPRTGLQDMYIRIKHDRNNFSVTLDIHNFMTAGKDVLWRRSATTPRIDPATGNQATDPVTGALLTDAVAFQKLNPTYGQEIDLVANYQINKFVNIEAGYSMFLATPTLSVVKGLPLGKDGYDKVNHWAYLQLNFRPEFMYQKPVAIKQ